MRLYTIALFSLLVLTSCSTAPTRPTTSTDPQQQALIALQEKGKFAESAQGFAALAATARSPQREQYRLQEASAWVLAKDWSKAQAAIQQAPRKRVGSASHGLHDLVSAEIALQNNDANTAGELLKRDIGSNDPSLQVRYFSALQQVQVAKGDFFGAAFSLAQVRASNLDANSRKQIETWIGKTNNATLSQNAANLPANNPLAPFVVRALNRRNLPIPAQLAGGTRIQFSADIPAAESDGYRPPVRIAVLLPNSGSLAGASSSIRDGILGAYYSQYKRRPSLRFYDTNSTAAGAKAAYAKALLEGAQLIIGPLGREEISSVLAQGNEIPVLALNRLPADGNSNAISFALSPEDEGEALAARLISRGQLRAQVVYENDEFARRALTAFRERYSANDGVISVEVNIAEGTKDFSPEVQKLNASNNPPAQALVIFSKANAARGLLSRIDGPSKSASTETTAASPTTLTAPVAPAAPIVPRYATSLITSGGGGSSTNQPLNNVEYPELPWIISGVSNIPSTEQVGKQLPSARGNGARLFGFGYDAFLLASYLEYLSQSPNNRIPGATGTLNIDSLGMVRRETTWAIYRNGVRTRAP
jgi:uncharacterized protein